MNGPALAGLAVWLFVAVARPAAAGPPAPVTGTNKAGPGPKILIFGGGWGPEGTQQSLEAQVDALRRTLITRTPTVLFAGGPAETRAVQIPGITDETTALLGLVFNQRRDLHTDYRPAQVPRTGPASRTRLLQVIKDHDSRQGTVVFGVGHGSLDDTGQVAALELWGPNDRLTPASLAAVLDQDRRGPTALVLGQCHSGGFANLVHRGADPQQPIARPVRCVFAAVPADREASGCTVDLNDAGAEAYISRFTQALDGTAADIDRSGSVDLAEAHAYSRIHDTTIDVPVSSLELFVERAIGARAPDPARADLRRLIASARGPDVAVLKALGPTYVTHPRGMAKARRDFETIQRQIQTGRTELDALQERFETTRRRLLDRLLMRWPELSNPYHVVSRALLAGPAPIIVGWLRSQSELERLRSLDADLATRDLRLLAVEKKAARLERWLRTVQFVANEAALRDQGHYKAALSALDDCEKMIP